ncbi:MAG: hypothetical protein QHH14_12195 [Clostridiales bacterium]|nr:hypothetical protein [Clostridiales bacterium]
MVLVDTSLWVHHLRHGLPYLQALLEKGQVVCHPFIIGELACGNLRNRQGILSLLEALPQATLALHEEVLRMVDSHRLMGIGLGYIDVHLLASALLTSTPIWSEDACLMSAATQLGIAYLPA